MDEPSIVVTGSYDDLRSGQVRLLAEAAKLGPVHVLLWSDQLVERLEGRRPKFPEAERLYLLEAIRYVSRVSLCRHTVGRDELCSRHTPCADSGTIPTPSLCRQQTWVVGPSDDNDAKRAFCRAAGLNYHVLRSEDLAGFPSCPDEPIVEPTRKRVIVTGCYDWFHSGHVRFFEEVAELGDVYVVVGHDANIKLLKGEGHPLFPERERQFLVQSIRYVKQTLISTGQGWLDAEPEIRRIRPHVYAVNEDGDRPEKRQYCQSLGIEYRVLKRLPKQGLPSRQSTDLRGY
jgi:cytidyltransferase-like protein